VDPALFHSLSPFPNPKIAISNLKLPFERAKIEKPKSL
jgi:hypothetical protein